eukprot:2960915-Alexandrium_andersonii.AAC.1
MSAHRVGLNRTTLWPKHRLSEHEVTATTARWSESVAERGVRSNTGCRMAVESACRRVDDGSLATFFSGQRSASRC